MEEIMKSTERKYEGKIISVRLDQVVLQNDKVTYREICEHPGGVAVLPLDDDMNVTLVRQFRYAFGKILTEIPAGKLDHGPESVLDCGKRELLEETGLTADEFIDLGAVYPSVGFLDEVIHLYLARGLHQGEACPDENEFVDCVKIPLKKLCEMAMNNEIEDAKTLIAVLKTKMIIDSEK
ncbi:MAG: NUDIX hydrolase [Clostridia bacterium]